MDYFFFTRELHTHQITLTKEENQVYQKILDFSRKALEQYIKSQEQKMRDGYDRESEVTFKLLRMLKPYLYSDINHRKKKTI